VIVVEEAGMLTTVQDLGRPGYQDQGVAVGGAVDAVALRVANLLVGNNEGAAGLEATLVGPRLRFEGAAVVAVTGASVRGVVMNRPWKVAAGEVVDLTALEGGCRAYVAVSGGIDVPVVMGSRSTYLPAGIGGLEGRALSRGDRLAVGRGLARGAVRRGLAGGFWMERRAPGEVTVRVVRGPQWEWFSEATRGRFLAEGYRVRAQSDRMGARLEGLALEARDARELVSEAVALGTVQVPADGQPIVLLADRPTIGGYPKIASVIGADIGLIAQARPGDVVRFRAVSPEEAERLFWKGEERLRWLRGGA
jgi:antagonist of KipI